MDISSVIRNVEWRAMRWCGHIERTAEKSSPKNVLNCSLLWGKDYCGGRGGEANESSLRKGDVCEVETDEQITPKTEEDWPMKG